MINNTTLTNWKRLQAKTLDAQFLNEMVSGLNCSNFEAEAIVQKVHEIYSPLLEVSPALKPGQIQIVVVDATMPPNIPLDRAKQRLVTLTLQDKKDEIDLRRHISIATLRQKRICRMCQEAFLQGGLLTVEDLASLFNCSVRTLSNDLAALRKDNIIPQLRSTVKDMGRAITHRKMILSLWLQGFEYSEIARKASHSDDSVANYVDKFKRCYALFASGFDVDTVAMIVKLSTALTKEIHEICSDVQGVPHRLKELNEFLKKNNVQSTHRRTHL